MVRKMNLELLEKLKQVTPEEQQILDGCGGIEKGRYTDQADFTIVSKKMLEKGKLVDIRTHTRFIEFPRHKHDYIEIIYMCSGKTVHWINGETKVVLEAGDLLFLNQHAFHAIEAADWGDIAINFIVLPEFFDVAYAMLEGENPLRNFIVNALCQNTGQADYLHFMVADILPVQNLIENLIWALWENSDSVGKILSTTMGLLFLNLLHYTDKIVQNCENQRENKLVMAALRLIEEDYQNANLTDLAKQMEEPLYSYSRIIRKKTGAAFKELLLRKRMDKAEQLLIETRLSISDIILAVGYDNTSYFYRVFRERYGMSPREYRERRTENVKTTFTE